MSLCQSILSLFFVNPISPILTASAPFYARRTAGLGSHVSWLSSLQNFSQKIDKQKFHLLKIKINGTIGFLNSFIYLFHCSDSSQSFLYPSFTYFHFNIRIYHHVPQYCISLSFPIFSSIVLSFSQLLLFRSSGCFSLPLFLPSLYSILSIIPLCFQSYCLTLRQSVSHILVLENPNQWYSIYLHPAPPSHPFLVHHTPFSHLYPPKIPLSVFHPLFPSFSEVSTQI